MYYIINLILKHSQFYFKFQMARKGYWFYNYVFFCVGVCVLDNKTTLYGPMFNLTPSRIWYHTKIVILMYRLEEIHYSFRENYKSNYNLENVGYFFFQLFI